MCVRVQTTQHALPSNHAIAYMFFSPIDVRSTEAYNNNNNNNRGCLNLGSAIAVSNTRLPQHKPLYSVPTGVLLPS